MSERWQRELEKLRTVGAPSSMRTRIDAGPTGEGVPPMPGRRQRVVAGMVAFAVFGAAIAFAWGAFGRDGSETRAAEPAPTPGAAVFTFLAHPTEGGANPTGTMTFADESIEAFGTSFCWDFGGGSMCADTIEPEFSDSDFGAVPAGTPVAFDGDARSIDGQVDTAGPFPFDRIRALDTSDAPVLPTEPGRYVIEFTATWSQGGRTFYFPIRIIDASAPKTSSLVATMTAPPDGSVPKLTLTYAGTKEEFFAQAGSWPGVDGFDQPLQVFSIPVAAGSHLLVEGDARNWVVDIKREGAADSEDTDGIAILDIPGTYLLTFKGVWDEGTVGFPVQIEVRDLDTSQEPSPPSPSAGESPSGAPVTVPDVVGMTDQQAMAALSDVGLSWIVAFRAADGELWHVVEMDPPAGSAIASGLEVRLVVATEITPLPRGAEDALACPAVDRVAFGGPHAVVLPAGEAWVRGNTGGIEKTDEVVPATSNGSSALWHVIRDGAVIAVVDDGTLDGVACAGSGVGAA
jgi:PASTA domain